IAGFKVSPGSSARRVSGSTNEQLKGRSRGGSLRIIGVNWGDQRRVRFAQNHHQSTRKRARSVPMMLLVCHFIYSHLTSNHAKRGGEAGEPFAVNLHLLDAVSRSSGGFFIDQ